MHVFPFGVSDHKGLSGPWSRTVGGRSTIEGKHFALVIKSSLFEGMFVDDKGVNITSLEIVRAKNNSPSNFFLLGELQTHFDIS